MQTNNDKPATKRQLWALFVASKAHGQKHDYRKDNLTMEEASKLLQYFNSMKVETAPKVKVNDLENRFLDYMRPNIQGLVATCREGLEIKSVVSDDPSIVTDKSKRKSYAFFGVGCGISVINFDKRSKVGKDIVELSVKHRLTTFLDIFMEGFTKDEIKYYDNVGFPLSAMYAQDYNIGSAYENYVAQFMRENGVKNVEVRTFWD